MVVASAKRNRRQGRLATFCSQLLLTRTACGSRVSRRCECRWSLSSSRQKRKAWARELVARRLSRGCERECECEREMDDNGTSPASVNGFTINPSITALHCANLAQNTPNPPSSTLASRLLSYNKYSLLNPIVQPARPLLSLSLLLVSCCLCPSPLCLPSLSRLLTTPPEYSKSQGTTQDTCRKPVSPSSRATQAFSEGLARSLILSPLSCVLLGGCVR